MPSRRLFILPIAAAAAALAVTYVAGFCPVFGQTETSTSLIDTGRVSVAGREVAYRIRNLPVSSFPELPTPVANALNSRNCLIPQTYEAHRPENVVRASLERTGSNDWAVLCSAEGRVSLLIFFGSGSAVEPLVLASFAKTDRLQAHGSGGELGFNWGIDQATPKRVHEAQAGMSHRPLPPDHDCLADSILDDKTVYHLYRNGAWGKVEVE